MMQQLILWKEQSNGQKFWTQKVNKNAWSPRYDFLLNALSSALYKYSLLTNQAARHIGSGQAAVLTTVCLVFAVRQTVSAHVTAAHDVDTRPVVAGEHTLRTAYKNATQLASLIH